MSRRRDPIDAVTGMRSTGMARALLPALTALALSLTTCTGCALWLAWPDTAMVRRPPAAGTGPTVIIVTAYPGASTVEVLDQISSPIETRLLGLPDVTRTGSRSSEGRSVVTVELAAGTDLWTARRVVLDRLARRLSEAPALAGAWIRWTGRGPAAVLARPADRRRIAAFIAGVPGVSVDGLLGVPALRVELRGEPPPIRRPSPRAWPRSPASPASAFAAPIAHRGSWCGPTADVWPRWGSRRSTSRRSRARPPSASTPGGGGCQAPQAWAADASRT